MARLLDSANNPLEQDHFIIPSDDLELLQKIGQGGMGFVYKAKYGASTIVAAKEIFALEMYIYEFEQEVRMLTQLHRPNILRVFGVCTKPPEVCEDALLITFE